MAAKGKDCEMCGGVGFIYDGVGSVMCPVCGGTGIQTGGEEEKEDE